MNWVDLTILTSGIAWTITYVALVYRGIKDKSYGMPLAPLALNIAWEITFSLIYPPHASGGLATVINTVWMICDAGIVITFFLYGYKYFREGYKISKAEWIMLSVLAFTSSFGIMIFGGKFFGQFQPYFHSEIFEGAKFIALIQNAVISVCFVLMYWQRQNSDGQSFTIAWSKWIGTSLTVGISYVFADHKGEDTSLIVTFILITFVFDTYYMQLIYNQLKKEGINPWTRL
jgi:hypothetical protein